MSETHVIIGAGHAGGQAAASLRSNGFTGTLMMIGEEPCVPYQRPPLSKKFLAREIPVEKTYLKPEDFYQEQNIGLLLNTVVNTIDRDSRRLQLADGSSLSYDRLLLTTGSVVRKIPVPGAELAGVHYLRTLADVVGIQADLKADARLVVIGAGYIGLEVAAVAIKLGLKVTVLEREARPLARVTGEEISHFFTQVHQEAGVDIRCNTGVSALEGDQRVQAVITDSGERFPADLVVVGVGILPATALAEAAGLDIDNGICVDEFARTNDPRIYAAGDCTSFMSGLYGTRIRLESVQNAMDQARTAAASMLDQPSAYDPVPRFWSDQYDLKLQIIGLNSGYEQTVLRGDPASRKFSVFYLREGVVIAADCVSNPQEFMLARKFIEGRIQADVAQLADPEVALKTLV